MAGLKTIQGALRPLFDRLVDDHPDQPFDDHTMAIMTVEELRDSLTREILRVVSTRMTMSHDQTDMLLRGASLGYGVPERFGLPDTTHYDAESPAHRKIVEDSIKQAILAFEPRLMGPEVKISGVDPIAHTLSIIITGQAQAGMQTVPIALPFDIEAP